MPTERERILKVKGCANLHLRQAARVVTEFYNSVMVSTGLHANQFSLLVPPYLNPGLTINQMAEISGLDRTTLARNLKLLEERGWIVVHSGADQRRREIHLTESGRQILLEALPLWEQAQEQVKATLGQEGLTQLFTYLDRLEELPQGNLSGGQD